MDTCPVDSTTAAGLRALNSQVFASACRYADTVIEHSYARNIDPRRLIVRFTSRNPCRSNRPTAGGGSALAKAARSSPATDEGAG